MAATAAGSARGDASGRRAELLERARGLAPALRARAAATEALGRLPDETVADLRASGLVGILKPARRGGAELDYGMIVEVAAELGRGCGSTAWVYANLAIHDWMLALWPPPAQAAVWDRDPEAFIASSMIFPAGRARRVDDGYAVSGHWRFSSGIDVSRWLMLGAMVEPATGDAGPEARMFILPKSDVEVLDTWQVAGLAGTGSKDFRCEETLVAEHMTLAASAVRGGATPGAEVNAAPLYRLPLLGLFPHVLAGPILGMAAGAYETFVDRTRIAVSTYNASRIAEHAAVQIKIAEAAVSVDTARKLLLDNCAEAMRIFGAGGLASVEEKHRWRRDAAFAVRLCTRAVDLVFAASGGGAIYAGNPLQRFFRDLHAGVAHIGVSWDVNGADYGRVALGLPGNPGV